MQLLDISLESNQPIPILNVLQHISENVQIEADFCIAHPDYKSLELPDEQLVSIQKSSDKIQEKYLRVQLQNFLYGIYYSGSLRSKLKRDKSSSSVLAIKQKLENNTFLGIDLAFFEEIHASNCGEGFYSPGWRIIREENGYLAVVADELTLHIDRGKYLQLSDQSAQVGDLVAIWTPKNRMQNGFYVAIGNIGYRGSCDPHSPAQTVRVYFNLLPEGVTKVMRSVTQHLNALQIPFSFKVLYNPKDYERFDSGVLYFDKSFYSVIQPVLQTIYLENQHYFQTEIPLFTKSLATGLALAEEPDQKFMNQESFGQNRCYAIAKGLLEARQTEDETSERRMTAIIRQFVEIGVDLYRPYLNSGSEDIYTPLDV